MYFLPSPPNVYEHDPPLADDLGADPAWYTLLDSAGAHGPRALAAIAGDGWTRATDALDPRATPEALLLVMTAARLVEARPEQQPPWRTHLRREYEFYDWQARSTDCAIAWLPHASLRIAARLHARAITAALEELLVADALSQPEPAVGETRRSLGRPAPLA